MKKMTLSSRHKQLVFVMAARPSGGSLVWRKLIGIENLTPIYQRLARREMVERGRDGCYVLTSKGVAYAKQVRTEALAASRKRSADAVSA